MQGAWVRVLVGELRSAMLYGEAKTEKENLKNENNNRKKSWVGILVLSG